MAREDGRNQEKAQGTDGALTRWPVSAVTPHRRQARGQHPGLRYVQPTTIRPFLAEFHLESVADLN